MKEIVTIQVGDFANYIGSHFWNFQDELLGLAEETHGDPIYRSPSLDMGTLYRAGETQQGNLTYTPRLISIGFQGSLGSLCSSGSLYDEIPSFGASNIFTWNGNVSRHVSEPFKKNLFLQSLQEEEQGKLTVSTNDFDEDRENPPRQVLDKDLVDCLENNVTFWTDYSKVHYHPRSLYELHGSWTDIQKFDNYGIGKDVLSGSFQGEEMNERLRFFMEECDHIQGIQFIVDDSGGFSSVAADFLENIVQEYTNTPILLYAARSPGSYMKATNQESISRALHDAVSFSRLSSFCNLMVPVGLPSLNGSKFSPLLRIDDAKPFHCSAVYAASIHSLSLPFRMELLGPTANSAYVSGAVDVGGLVQMLAGQARQNMVTILDTAMPAPTLNGEQSQGSFQRSLHSLTPEIAGDDEDLHAVESLVVHGALHSGGRRALISEVKDLVYDAYQNGVAKPMFSHLSAALCPLPIPLPFPSIFENNVGQHGVLLDHPIQGTLSRGSLEVNSIPMAARLRSTNAILPFIAKRLGSLRRFGIETGAPGAWLLRSWGFAQDEVEDMGEVLSKMAKTLDSHSQLSSDSD